MTLLALGINHKTAPVAVREKVAFAPDLLPSQLRDANSAPGMQEIAILSTCNRTELYCTVEGIDASHLLEWIEKIHGVPMDKLAECHYALGDEDAVKHLMRVASGLDSLI